MGLFIYPKPLFRNKSMEIDNTSFNDLSIFHTEEEFSIFHKLNFTQTSGGKEWLMRFFSEPLNNIHQIRQVQMLLQVIARYEDQWPQTITNGTIMVIERFYEAQIDTIPDNPFLLNAYSYKILHGPDYSLVRYTAEHVADFVRGFFELDALFNKEGMPALLRNQLQRAMQLLNNETLQRLADTKKGSKLSPKQAVYFGNYIRYRFKHAVRELIDIFGKLDAWYSMAKAVKTYQLGFPEFVESSHPQFEAKQLYHVLLHRPVAYDVELEPEKNFLFLTGANMAGKSTFIKSVGAAVYLAHLGMGVPAQSCKLTLFDGILSNINVVDNIVRGESYFFNEVQRIKNTILKINDGHKWLVLIDELFKGTNVQDAMKCSSAVIRGLIKISNSLFILSTHLYEIAGELNNYPNIIFRYFETEVKEDQLLFSYQLKNGISNDRIGYLILKQEKVVDMLENL